MKLDFSKYEGTGNDFIIFDGYHVSNFHINETIIKKLCDRKYGIGADGLIVLKKDEKTDFYLDYFNADGSQSFCGNGSRCGTHFALNKNIIKKNHTTFAAIDGIHEAFISHNQVNLKMADVHIFRKNGEHYIIHTGSPHYLEESDDLSTENTIQKGRKIRYSKTYESEGINVNLFRKISNSHAQISTYERGVENETLSCGTGATACGIALNMLDSSVSKAFIESKGGNLEISFEYDKKNQIYKQVYLKGSVNLVFHGTIEI